jgi:hypothetical protein
LLKDKKSVYATVSTDAPLRERPLSSDNMHAAYLKETWYGTYNLSGAKRTEVNRACQEMICIPLLRCPTSKDPLAPMHTPHGIIGHLFKNIRQRLRAIDMKSPWQKEVDTVYADVKAFLSNTEHFKTQKAQFASISRKITIAKKDLEKALERNTSVTAQQAHVARDNLSRLEDQRKAYCDLTGLGQHNLLRITTQDLKDAVETSNKAKRRIPRGPAEYTFDQALPLFGRASYMKYPPSSSGSMGCMVYYQRKVLKLSIL